MKKHLLAYLFFLLCATPALATSIVIVVTPQYILIGTDSKRMYLDAGAQVIGTQSVCKIRTAGSYCYALAGMVAGQATAFNADSIVAHYLSKTTDQRKAIRQIQKALVTALSKELKQEQRQNSQAIPQRNGDTATPLLEVVILSMHKGVPQMHLLGFSASTANTIVINSYQARCPGDCPQQNRQVFFLGSYRTMEQMLPLQQPLSDPAQMVEQLIIGQSKATPSSVGGPVHLVRYSAAGVEWLKQ